MCTRVLVFMVLLCLQVQEVRSSLHLVTHSVRLLSSPGLDGHALSISNIVDVRKESNKASHTHSIPAGSGFQYDTGRWSVLLFEV